MITLREERYLSDIANGRGEYEWAPIVLHGGSHSLTVRVMSDALMLSGIRIAVRPPTLQAIADHLGAVLLTPKLCDAIWAQADIKIPPSPGAPHATDEAIAAHSARVSRLVAKRHGLVSTAGKDWVLTNRLVGRRDKAANYGWHAPGKYWLGIRLHPSETLPGIGVIQPLATVHGVGHVDYSQTVRLASNRCVLDGQEIDLRDVLSSPTLAHLASHEGRLAFTRLGAPASPPPPTVPGTLAERAAQRCIHEAKRWGAARPDALTIAAYFRGCERAGKPLGLTAGNFCAAAQGWAESKAALPEEKPPPWRAAAKEIMWDAKAGRRGGWHPRAEVLAGSWRPAPGALAVYQRGEPTSWMGHVDRVVSSGADGYVAVGANERGGAWTIEPARFDNPKLLGFVEW